MKKNFLSILSLTLVLPGLVNIEYSTHRLPAMFKNNRIGLFADKDWQVIINVNKFYIVGIGESKVKSVLQKMRQGRQVMKKVFVS